MKTKLLILSAAAFLLFATPVMALDSTAGLKQKIMEWRNIPTKYSTDDGVLKKGSISAFMKAKGELKSAVLGMLAKVSGTLKSKGDNSLVITVGSQDITVNIDAKTKLRRRFGGVSTLSEMQVGDNVQVLGKWTDSTKTAVNALFVRDDSIQKVHAVLVGTITGISGDTITMSTKARGDQVVTVGTGTKYVGRDNTLIDLSKLSVGNRIRVKGVWDRALNHMVEVSEIKDYDLPI